MAKVTFMGTEYECATAIRGSDYIHLIDSNGVLIATFDGIVDFSAFTITSGTWSAARSDEACNIAIIGEDGVVRRGPLKCTDIMPTIKYLIKLSVTAWLTSGDAYLQTINISGIVASDLVVLNPVEQLDWAYGTLDADVTTNDYITFTTHELPATDINIEAYVIKTHKS